MPLNIKNERVSRLAHELARLTGESITDAIGKAIEARLAELRRARNRDQMTERLVAIGKACADAVPADWRNRNFDEELYDDRWLPK